MIPKNRYTHGRAVFDTRLCSGQGPSVIMDKSLETDMRNEFTAVIERDGKWYIAYCPEIPGANGQGRTINQCRKSLAQAIALILEDRREDGLRGVPTSAIRETVTVE
jgi:predicted RNase H-like HicB family nuclease